MDKVAAEALELFRQLAEKMGTTVERLYPYFVRQAYFEALATILGWLSACTVLFVAATVMHGWAKRKLAASKDKDTYGPLICLGQLLRTLAILVAIATTFYWLPQLLNPDYWAVREILRSVTGK